MLCYFINMKMALSLNILITCFQKQQVIPITQEEIFKLVLQGFLHLAVKNIYVSLICPSNITENLPIGFR